MDEMTVAVRGFPPSFWLLWGRIAGVARRSQSGCQNAVEKNGRKTARKDTFPAMRTNSEIDMVRPSNHGSEISLKIHRKPMEYGSFFGTQSRAENLPYLVINKYLMSVLKTALQTTFLPWNPHFDAASFPVHF
jgi:hypothetical protein